MKNILSKYYSQGFNQNLIVHDKLKAYHDKMLNMLDNIVTLC